jgi:hypothetical protein
MFQVVNTIFSRFDILELFFQTFPFLFDFIELFPDSPVFVRLYRTFAPDAAALSLGAACLCLADQLRCAARADTPGYLSSGIPWAKFLGAHPLRP